MKPGVVRRYTLLAAIALASAAIAALVADGIFGGPPGSYAVTRGDQLLSGRDWNAALTWFDKALGEDADHPGALMGRAIALMQLQQVAAAEETFTRLISRLSTDLANPPADNGGEATARRGMLAAAYANRGVLKDRSGRAAEALADYKAALAVDAAAVDGPGVIERILSGNPQPSSVAARARYLEQQFRLPEAERRLYLPEIDARQRMHKP
jgi:tetratricopeptide (TPR) repeat protein